MEQLPFWQRLTEHPAYDEFWQDQAVDRILARAPLTVPTLFVDSLWDQEDIYGAPAVFNAVKASAGNAHLVLGPWHHGQANGAGHARSARSTGARTPASGSAQNVMMPFLDQHLKGGPPADIARVTAFEAGTNQWQRLADWPQACMRGCPANLTPLYLAPATASASTRPPARAFDSLCLRPRQARHLPRPAQPLALGQRLDLALLAGRRPALRRRPPRRPHLHRASR